MFKKLILFSLLVACACTRLNAQTVAYVTNGGNTVSVIDIPTNIITGTIAVGNGATGVSFSPDGSRAYVVNTADASISVVDTSTNTAIATILLTAGTNAFYASVTPDGKTLYVADQNAGNVELVSTATNSVIDSIPVDGSFDAVALTPDGAILGL